MPDDNDELRGTDLSAWEVPPPSRDLADAVVARMREAAAASPVTTAIAVPPSRRRWIIAAGFAVAAVAAILVIALAGSSRDDAHGTLAADRPQHLDIADASAELDAGAEVRWQRDGDTIHAEQPRGAVRWTSGSQHLVIDPGAMGASVEATGASLRVEVQMNHADARVLAVSSATAAIAAIVTVIVYEGHVKVRNAGQTIAIAPGATVEITPSQPPHVLADVGGPTPAPPVPAPAPSTVAADNLDDVDGALTQAPCAFDAMRARGAQQEAAGEHHGALDDFEQALDCKPSDDVERLATMAACNGHNASRARVHYAKVPDSMRRPLDMICARSGITLSAPCDAAAAQRRGVDHVNHADFAQALQSFEESLACKPTNEVVKLAFLSACNSSNVPKSRAYFKQLTSQQQKDLAVICVRHGIDLPASTSCDAAKSKEDGTNAVNMGQFALALVKFEDSLACKRDPEVVRLAYLSACNSKNAPKSRTYFKLLPPQQQKDLAVICERNLIDLADTGCDAAKPMDDGNKAVNMGQFALALGLFEQSLACKPTEEAIKLAYLAACNSKNAPKAKLYYARMPSSQQKDLQVVCIRNLIQVP